MKKLLSTTAILGALAFSATPAEAANLQVNVGGFLDFQAGYIDDDVNESLPGHNKVTFNNDAEIHFTVEGKADNGLEYGAVIELEADIGNTDNQQNGGLNADKTYLFVQGGWGRVELGGNTDAAEALSVNSSTFASATGGIDGDFYRYLPSAAGLNGFFIRPDLPLAHNGGGLGFNPGTDEDATKITYYTPRFSGFQAGVSYIPQSEDIGTAVPAAGAVGEVEHVFSGGINYSADFDTVGVKAAITGQTGDAKRSLTGEDLRAWDAGVNVSFSGFTVGGSYADIDESPAFGPGTDARSWDVGVGYAAGPFSVSATYFDSEVDFGGGVENDFQNLSIGVDYQLAPGLVPYAEVSFFDADSDAGAPAGVSNDGTIVLIGTELTF